MCRVLIQVRICVPRGKRKAGKRWSSCLNRTYHTRSRTIIVMQCSQHSFTCKKKKKNCWQTLMFEVYTRSANKLTAHVALIHVPIIRIELSLLVWLFIRRWLIRHSSLVISKHCWRLLQVRGGRSISTERTPIYYTHVIV